MTALPPNRASTRPSLNELGWFAAAIPALVMASLAIRLLPFRLVTRTMALGGYGRSRRDARPAHVAIEAVRAVRRASRRLPWRTACFQQGLAAHWLLRMRGLPSVLHYGIRPGEHDLSAHVWVSLDGFILIGEEQAGSHACVAEFPRPAC